MKNNYEQYRQHGNWDSRKISPARKNEKPWRHEEINQMRQELRSLKREMNQKDRSNIEEEGQDERDQEIIYSERCGSGPYRSASSYRSHIYQKHDGKTPNKNKFWKSGVRIKGN